MILHSMSNFTISLNQGLPLCLSKGLTGSFNSSSPFISTSTFSTGTSISLGMQLGFGTKPLSMILHLFVVLHLFLSLVNLAVGQTCFCGGKFFSGCATRKIWLPSICSVSAPLSAGFATVYSQEPQIQALDKTARSYGFDLSKHDLDEHSSCRERGKLERKHQCHND